VENYGPALLDRALLDALCRALGASFYRAVQANLVGAGSTEGIDLGAFFATLKPRAVIAARHTVGLVDPITAADQSSRVGDGLPETLEEVVARYGHRHFKLKVGGDLRSDVARLAAIAAVLDRIDAPYRVSLDGNEQYEDMQGVAALWAAMQAEPRLARLVASVLFIEQPVKRSRALERRVEGIDKPVIIDESDDALDAFPRAKALGYRGVSSKTCKGLYKSLLNGARCAQWGDGYFMSGEDLTIQAGLALQQDTALVSLLGITHLERNGHHYVNGMAALPKAEQDAFLAAHPDLYERSHGAVRLRIAEGMLAVGSLDCPGYASRAMPDWNTMREMKLHKESA
jgi:L-alanine-DL-glutamate epimerase-like enolase superfamily enzyme